MPAGGSLLALGRRLRQAREARHVSATVLADRLRLGVEQLEALELGARDRLPEPVFVIAQARRVAAALQLDITAELQALRDSGELQPRPRPGLLVLPRPLPAALVAATAQAAGEPAPQPQAAERPVPRLRAAGRLSLLTGAALLLLALLWAGWRLRGSVATGADPPRLQVSSPASADADAEAVAAGMVVLASREPSWLEVRRPDGVILFRGLLRGSRTFALQQGLEVMAARPDLVSSRTGSAPAQILGDISDVRWRSLPAGR